MTRDYFGKEAAGALIGKPVRSLRAFRGVPKGTIGRVIRTYPTGNGDNYSVGVQWDLPWDSRKLPVYRFSRDEYYEYLIDIDTPNKYMHGDGLMKRKSDGKLVVQMGSPALIYSEDGLLSDYKDSYGFATPEMLLGSPEHLERLRNLGSGDYGYYPRIPTGPGNLLKGGTTGRLPGMIRLNFITSPDVEPYFEEHNEGDAYFRLLSKRRAPMTAATMRVNT